LHYRVRHEKTPFVNIELRTEYYEKYPDHKYHRDEWIQFFKNHAFHDKPQRIALMETMEENEFRSFIDKFLEGIERGSYSD
jgi:hypothetical protein